MKFTLLAIFGCVFALKCLHALINSRRFQLFGHLIFRVRTNVPVVAITLDDMPDPVFGSDILDIMRSRDVRATFFICGAGVTDERVLSDIVRDGHELGNHSWSHKRMILTPLDVVAHEVEETDKIIRRASGRREIFFRPPYCKKLFTLPIYLARTKRTTLTWNIEPESLVGRKSDAVAMANATVAKAEPGSIIVLHVAGHANGRSRAALPLILDGLTSRGFKLVTASELVGLTRASRAASVSGA